MKKAKLTLFFVMAVLAITVGMTETLGAQTVTPAPVAVAPPAPAVVPAGTQVSAPASVSLTPSQPAVALPANAAPPAWATQLLATVAKLPVVGPYVTQILLWLGILAAILTALVASALTILASLKGAFAWAGLDSAVAAIDSFKSGPIMYWLTYFSNFNAKKPSA